MFMLSQNVVNPDKKGKVLGQVFHLFYPNLNSAFLFDRDFTVPIIWGSKNVVMTALKDINELMPTADKTTKVRIYSYITSTDGYRRIDTYNGPIETIGKYIRRY
jgi:hypothetical protein